MFQHFYNFSRDFVVLSNIFSYGIGFSIFFFMLSIFIFRSLISTSFTSLYLIARDLSSLNFFDKSSNLFFCSLIRLLKSKCSSINLIEVINKSLFSPIFPSLLFNSKYFLSKKEVNFFKDSSCPSSQDKNNPCH